MCTSPITGFSICMPTTISHCLRSSSSNQSCSVTELLFRHLLLMCAPYNDRLCSTTGAVSVQKSKGQSRRLILVLHTSSFGGSLSRINYTHALVSARSPENEIVHLHLCLASPHCDFHMPYSRFWSCHTIRVSYHASFRCYACPNLRRNSDTEGIAGYFYACNLILRDEGDRSYPWLSWMHILAS